MAEALKGGFGEFEGDFEYEFLASGWVAAVGVSAGINAVEVVHQC